MRFVLIFFGRFTHTQFPQQNSFSLVQQQKQINIANRFGVAKSFCPLNKRSNGRRKRTKNRLQNWIDIARYKKKLFQVNKFFLLFLFRQHFQFDCRCSKTRTCCSSSSKSFVRLLNFDASKVKLLFTGMKYVHMQRRSHGSKQHSENERIANK